MHINIVFPVEELGIKEIMPAYVDPSIDDKELLTGVSFASGGSGYDPQTSKIVVTKTTLCKQFPLFIVIQIAFFFLENFINHSNPNIPS